MNILRLNPKDITRGHLILVNPSHPVPGEVSRSSLVSVNQDTAEILMENQAAKALSDVMNLLNCDHEIVPVSGYRTMQEQQEIYADSLREHGIEFTRKYVALPGCSEHQTGLAIDLAENRSVIDFIRPVFSYTGICARFREVSVQHGFVERYPAGRERITGIAHEPWHFRYVGHPHSEIMTRENLTLEEYTEYLKQFPFPEKPLRLNSQSGIFEIFYFPLQENKEPDYQEKIVKIPDGTPYQVSGNNVDGVVVTFSEAVYPNTMPAP